MIIHFRHKGLKRLFERGDGRRLNPQQLERIELILADLDAAESLAHLHRPGYRLHALQGQWDGFYALDVSGSWRIVFRFHDGMVSDVDLVDYH